jgi:hypothetical protein
LRDAGLRRQCADRLFTFAAQSLEQRPPGGIRERSEQGIVNIRHIENL